MLFNTLHRAKEEFQPMRENTVRMYSCGPTVYSEPHIGNLRAYIFVDLLRKTLLAQGWKMQHVMNLTDVGHLVSDADDGEDKMEKAARETGKNAWELAEHFTGVFKENLADLHIAAPDIWAKATDHIEEQIALVTRIEEQGFTYQTSDGIYLDTSRIADYPALGVANVAGMEEGARVEKNPEKKHPSDFALWKFSQKNEQRQMEWNSPWGKGFPGWHLECTAMSAKYLGNLADIHTGGVDHASLHHPNEIAQSQAAYGTQEARFWMHNEFLVVDSGRMGKSEGNTLTLETLKEKGYDPLAYRYFVLSAHYRQKLTFSWEGMDGAQAAYHKLITTFSRLNGEGKTGCAEFEQRFKDAMNDDLNTPQALAVLWELLKSDHPDSAKRHSALVMDELLSLGLAARAQQPTVVIPQEVHELLKKREDARVAKDFAKSDALRDAISKAGFIIEDTPDGPRLLRG
jgi:cysteinyl-tRNA synthetase